MKAILGLFTLLLLAVLSAHAAETALTIPLAGTWRFGLDPKSQGVTEEWFNRALPDAIEMPGSCEQRGFGYKPAREETKRLTHVLQYVGKAWYQRDLDIPKSWAGKRIELFLERCHWETTVWVDGREIGMQNSLSAPHLHDLGQLSPGKHTLTVCVDNTYKLKIGTWGHSITEDTQGNWNGMIGRLEMRATDPVWIRDVQVFPSKLKVKVGNKTGQPVEAVLQAQKITIPAAGGEFELPFAGNGKKWDEFTPDVQQLTLKLTAGKFSDTKTVTYGLRELATRNKQFILNGRPIQARGAVDECVYPLTGYPPMDKAAWLRVLGICKSHGFNFMRFHTWCPPKAAFEAADDLGFLLWVELPLWTIHGAAHFGEDAPRDQFIRDELDRILETYGNHPSFGFMAMGNESAGDLKTLVKQGRTKDPRRLFRCENGITQAYGDFVERGQRGILGPRTDWDRSTINGDWISNQDVPTTWDQLELPTLSHEVGQWAMYPDFDEAKKYTGTLRQPNYARYRQSLAEHHMLDQARDFAQASGKFSVQLYKDEIEACLRTWPYGGFQLLEARDYPGQGTALVGWLDAFWDSKGLITPEEFRRFCGPTVCLLRMPARVYSTAESFTATAQVSHFGPKNMEAKPEWSIADERGQVIAKGQLPQLNIEPGRLATLGEIKAPLESVKAPARLVVTLKAAGNENSWNIWVYPATQPPAPTNVRVVHSFDQTTRDALAAGERVVMMPPSKFLGPEIVREASGPLQNVLPGSFMPTFWSLGLFGQIGTLGLLCDPEHPALAQFPTEKHSDWQWADLLGRFSGAYSFHCAWAPNQFATDFKRIAGDVYNRSKVIVLDETPPDFRPIVQVIDNFDRNSKLGAIFEARVGPGKLLVCAMDLDVDADKRPAARQLRRSLLDYAASDKFNPAHELPAALLTRLLADRPGHEPGMKATADSEMTGMTHAAANAIDGNSDTIWHTPFGAGAPGFPHILTVELQQSSPTKACTLLPRQDAYHNGGIKAFEIYASDDGKAWGEPVAKGELPPTRDLKRITFPKPVTAKFLKLVVLSGFNADPFISLAEFDVER